ncbi:hypothetical protein SOCEGT47_069850 [Sorangium cellulosum]|uniref:Uncharacterized protein n=1 Tax=Sorangium cellulosum TaxID=56 RepID=A0A4P2QBD6_SORCE|nr:hypothetical protein [Sorangium cellulosum]AUX26423.1 hypothetical protein SOCEGT47_069850 [Sorangium cellulosum]
MDRWRGLKDLVVDAVDHGSRAVERLQKHAAKLPFDLLEQIPPIKAPVRGIRLVHDTALSGVHGAIRLVNRAVGGTVDGILFLVEQKRRPPEAPGDSAGGAPDDSAGGAPGDGQRAP